MPTRSNRRATPVEPLDRRVRPVQIDVQGRADGERDRGVPHVVAAGHPQGELDNAPIRKREPRPRPLGPELSRHDPRLRVRREPDPPRWDPGRPGDPERPGVICPDDQPRRSARELDERPFKRLEGPIALEMIRFNVRHHCDRRHEREKRPIELVSLGDEQVASPDPDVPMPCCDTAAGEPCRVSPGGRQRLRDHHRGRGLAVGSCHGHHGPARHGLAEGVGPPHYRYSLRSSPCELRMVTADRCAHHHRPHPVEVRRIVASPHRYASGCQIGGSGGVPVTPGDRETLVLG